MNVRLQGGRIDSIRFVFARKNNNAEEGEYVCGVRSGYFLLFESGDVFVSWANKQATAVPVCQGSGATS